MGSGALRHTVLRGRHRLTDASLEVFFDVAPFAAVEEILGLVVLQFCVQAVVDGPFVQDVVVFAAVRVGVVTALRGVDSLR